MKKVMLVLSLCLMSVFTFAEGRQLVANLPAETPNVSVTLDGKNHVVEPTTAVCQENGNSVICTVYANKDNASVKLPISYDTVLDFAYRAAELSYNLHIITDAQWQDIQKYKPTK